MNTIIESWVDVDGDIAAINAGKALWDRDSNTWSINGRRYKPDGDGARVMPVDGIGFHPTDRTTYATLQVYIQYGGPGSADAINYLNLKGVPQQVRDAATALWRLRTK